MPEKHGDSKELLKYAVAQTKQRRYATAQAFWVFAFENFVREEHEKTGKSQYIYEENGKRRNKTTCERIKDLPQSSKKDILFDLNKNIRNKIVHVSFLNEDNKINDIMVKLIPIIFEEKDKTLAKLESEVDIEEVTRLALKLGDRKDYKESQVSGYLRIQEEDFYKSEILEKKVWALKWQIHDLLQKETGLDKLETGLVSEFNVDSAWIWVPIGHDIKNENRRVTKAIISVLILRNMQVRVYLDFGTNANPYREAYYNLLVNGRNFKNKLLELVKKYNNFKFFNVKSYCLFKDIEPSIIENWLKGNIDEYDKIISDWRINLENESKRRSNILLFGKEFPADYFSQEKKIEDFAEDILEVVKILKPFLDIIEQEVKVG